MYILHYTCCIFGIRYAIKIIIASYNAGGFCSHIRCRAPFGTLCNTQYYSMLTLGTLKTARNGG